MASKPEYCTCAHLKRDAVRGACKVAVSFVPGSLGGLDEEQWLACTRCDLLGSRNDPSYMEHFISQKHYIGVRLKEPLEMFCVPCQDYQYHSDFDRRLGLSRLTRWGAPTIVTEQRPSSVSPPLDSAGFVNMGNTCFLSSVMQPLLHNAVLQQYYYRSPTGGCASAEHVTPSGPGTSCIACSVQDIYRDKMANHSALTPSGLLHAMWAQFSYMAAYEQQDAHEFLVALLDGLSTHLQRHHATDCAVLQHFMPPHETETVHTQTGAEGVDDGGGVRVVSPDLKLGGVDVAAVSSYYSTGHFKFHGIVNEAFSGVLRSDLACGSCMHRSFKFEPFRDISLSLSVPQERSHTDDVKSREHPSPKRRRVESPGPRAMTSSLEDVSSLLLDDDEDGHEAADTDHALDIKDVPDLPDELFLPDEDDAVVAAKTISLHNCFVQFTSPELLTEMRYCDNCQGSCSMTKQLSFFTPPNVLIIHLKRFDAFGHNKVRSHVSMPLVDLNLRDFFCMTMDDATNTGPDGGANGTAATETHDESTQGMMFDLQGVVCHKGESLSQGHYVSYVLCEDEQHRSGDNQQQWIRCDDEKVSEVPDEEVEACEGYILFYVNKATKKILKK